MVNNSHSRGNELPVCEPFFDCIRSKGAHLLIKSDEPEFREVLSNARFVFENKKVCPAKNYGTSISYFPNSAPGFHLFGEFLRNILFSLATSN